MQHQKPLSMGSDNDRPQSAASSSGRFMIRLSGLSISAVILSSVSIALFTGRIASFYLTAQQQQTQGRAECQAEVVLPPIEPIEKVMNYEALVHPAMITHTNPKKVGVYGGNDKQTSATLTEILKHMSVTKTVIFGNGNEVQNDVELDGEHPNLFDVIIDPNPMKASANFLSYFSSLDSDGVLALSSETMIANNDPALGEGKLEVIGTAIDSLEEAGFESIHLYEDENFGTHSFIIAFKSYDSRAEWYSNGAEFNIRLHQQIGRTESLEFFDAPTMLRYQNPRKAVETVFCHGDEEDECEEFSNRELTSVPLSDLSVGQSTMGEHSGRGIFAKKDIPKGRLIGFEKSWLSYYIYPSSHRIIMELYDWADEDSSDDDDDESDDEDGEDYVEEVHESIGAVVGFSEGYGFWASLLGRSHSTVDSGLMMFCNHGCNGTYNLSDKGRANETELSVDPYQPPEFRTSPFNPFVERNLHHGLASGDITNRDIKKGEEILCNYLEFVGRASDWKEDVLGLQGQCAGTELGAISGYEKAKRSYSE